MADKKEKKQYITQIATNGNVMISEDVIATIAMHALEGIEGYAGLSSKYTGDLVELLNAKNWGKGIRVYISDKNDVSVECNIVIYYGENIMTIADSIQDAILSGVNSCTGIQLDAVNINVCGIAKK